MKIQPRAIAADRIRLTGFETSITRGALLTTARPAPFEAETSPAKGRRARRGETPRPTQTRAPPRRFLRPPAAGIGENVFQSDQLLESAEFGSVQLAICLSLQLGPQRETPRFGRGLGLHVFVEVKIHVTIAGD